MHPKHFCVELHLVVEFHPAVQKLMLHELLCVVLHLVVKFHPAVPQLMLHALLSFGHYFVPDVGASVLTYVWLC